MSLYDRVPVIVMLSGAFALAAGCAAQTPTLQYAPAVVRVSGTVVFEEHYGPPGFGENPATDTRVRVPVLHLDRFIRVPAPGRGGINSATADTVNRLGLLGLSIDWPRYGGKHVVLEGTLFQRETANQITAVMMQVRRVVRGHL